MIPSMTVYDDCGSVGVPLTSPIVAIPSGGLLSDEPTHFTLGEVLHGPWPYLQFSDAVTKSWPSGLTDFVTGSHVAKSLNVAELECPTFGAGSTTVTGQAESVYTTVGPPWLPYILPPLQISTLLPEWSSVCAGRVAANIMEVIDPPSVLGASDHGLLQSPVAAPEPTPNMPASGQRPKAQSGAKLLAPIPTPTIAAEESTKVPKVDSPPKSPKSDNIPGSTGLSSAEDQHQDPDGSNSVHSNGVSADLTHSDPNDKAAECHVEGGAAAAAIDPHIRVGSSPLANTEIKEVAPASSSTRQSSGSNSQSGLTPASAVIAKAPPNGKHDGANLGFQSDDNSAHDQRQSFGFSTRPVTVDTSTNGENKIVNPASKSPIGSVQKNNQPRPSATRVGQSQLGQGPGVPPTFVEEEHLSVVSDILRGGTTMMPEKPTTVGQHLPAATGPSRTFQSGDWKSTAAPADKSPPDHAYPAVPSNIVGIDSVITPAPDFDAGDATSSPDGTAVPGGSSLVSPATGNPVYRGTRMPSLVENVEHNYAQLPDAPVPSEDNLVTSNATYFSVGGIAVISNGPSITTSSTPIPLESSRALQISTQPMIIDSPTKGPATPFDPIKSQPAAGAASGGLVITSDSLSMRPNTIDPSSTDSVTSPTNRRVFGTGIPSSPGSNATSFAFASTMSESGRGKTAKVVVTVWTAPGGQTSNSGFRKSFALPGMVTGICSTILCTYLIV